MTPEPRPHARLTRELRATALLSAPLVMPIRWAGGQVPPWQLVVAMLLTAATAALLALFASTVYRRALLITGRRAKLREVVRPRAAG